MDNQQTIENLQAKKNNISHVFQIINNLYQQEKGKKEQLLQEKNAMIDEKKEIENENVSLMSEKILLQKASEKGKRESCEILERIVSKSLDYIFDEKIDFKVIPKFSNSFFPSVEFETEVVRGNSKNTIMGDPVEMGGIGIVDAISIAIRTTMLNIVDKENQAPIFYDEPGKSISKEFLERTANYLQESRKTFDRQMFLITHHDIINSIGDKTFSVNMENGVSKINEVFS